MPEYLIDRTVYHNREYYIPGDRRPATFDPLRNLFVEKNKFQFPGDFPKYETLMAIIAFCEENDISYWYCVKKALKNKSYQLSGARARYTDVVLASYFVVPHESSCVWLRLRFGILPSPEDIDLADPNLQDVWLSHVSI